MATKTNTSIAVECRECGADNDIDVYVTHSRGHEEFWGAPVSFDETEVDYDSLECTECGKEAIDYQDLYDRTMEKLESW